MHPKRLFVALAAALGLTGCFASKHDLAKLRKEAAACLPGESCVFAGGLDCSCPAPVNAKRAVEVDEFAAGVSCFGEGQVECGNRADSAAECVEGQCRPAAVQPLP